MGTPHNIKRYGELWPSYQINHALIALEPLRDFIILSGGWAWHFLSPVGQAVQASTKLLDQKIDPIDREELVSIPT